MIGDTLPPEAEDHLSVFGKSLPLQLKLREVQKALGVKCERMGCVRPGYSEQQLFRSLKHGFDVMHVRSFLRFFVETVRTFVASATRGLSGRDAATARVKKIHKWASPFWRVAYQVDLLFLMTRGFSFIVTCKRHIWLPLNAPVLVDGRSIGEAALSKAGE